MTLGARPEAGGVRFRVWAPASSRVEVVLDDPAGEQLHALAPEGDGYFSGTVEGAGAGARYRYRLDDGDAYPDPASRSQPDGVHGPSAVVDPEAYRWSETAWGGVPLDALVIYELHIGTFTEEGTFDAAAERLDHVARLGATAVEVMPIANFAGTRNWGYDGVNLFAPATAYGGADGFRRFVDAAHGCGLAVLLDVVYNHLGPEGNYLPAVTGGRFFTDRHTTPWGDAVNFDGDDSAPVRDFVVQNALHWLVEYRVDGLRLDATHAIVDDSDPHILAELAENARRAPGPPRILIAEDERNDRALLLPPEQGGYGLDAVWADDLHHQLRRLTAGDDEGYFAHYSGSIGDVVGTLRRGWWRRGEHDAFAGGILEGTSPEGIPPPRFVHCIQNHDQVGNRALGERLHHEIELSAYRALSALLLVSPYTPMLWMGQEWAATAPFLYFTDLASELGRLVTEGRRAEFGHFAGFRDPERRARIPDPQAAATFERSKLRWEEQEEDPHGGVLALYRALLDLRRGSPAMRGGAGSGFDVTSLGEGALAIRRWGAGGDALLAVVNVRGEVRVELPGHEVTAPPEGRPWSLLLSTEEARFGGGRRWGRLEPEGTLHVVEPVAVILAA